MSTTKILTYVFGVISVILAYLLYNSINSSIEAEKQIARVEARVIEQLKMIREAELAYASVYGQYTSDYDKLLAFVDSGKFYLVQKVETIIPLAYGRDSIYVEIDTLGTKSVQDSIFKADKWPRFELASLPYVPGLETPTKFLIWADKIEKSGVKVNVIEVVDPMPVNKLRKEDNEINSMKPLRFGSRTSVTTAGNWE